MDTYQIDIDGYIGDWGYSKGYVKQKLNECKGKPVLMRLCSNGGSLAHGMGINDRIKEHGDVTVHMYGFNASSSTIAAIGAKKVCMSANGFYLIHKVMSPVSIWENLNADQLETLIADLISEKLENDKIDQVIAQMYANKTGKTLEQMLQLMKVGGWMNAREAKEWGFIDEILDDKEKINMVSMKEKLNAFGLPTNRINNEDLFNSKISKEMKKQPVKINAVIGVEQLESSEEGVYLNETQIEAIETKLVENENSISTSIDATKAAEKRAETAEATVTTQATKITELEAQIENLKKGPGESTGKSNEKTDKEAAAGQAKDSFTATVESARKLYDALPD